MGDEVVMDEKVVLEDKIVAFFDSVQRTVIGINAGEDDVNLKVENPVVVDPIPSQDGNGMALRLLPVFFREFMSDPSNDIVVNYNKSQISIVDPFKMGWDEKLITHFKNAGEQQAQPVTQPQAPQAPTSEVPDANVVNLFDED